MTEKCTWPRCRTRLKAGEGQQFVRNDRNIDRYCIPHSIQEWNIIGTLNHVFLGSVLGGEVRKENSKRKE